MKKAIILLACILLATPALAHPTKGDKKGEQQPHYLHIKNNGHAHSGVWTGAAVTIFPSRSSCEEARTAVNSECGAVKPGMFISVTTCSAVCRPVVP